MNYMSYTILSFTFTAVSIFFATLFVTQLFFVHRFGDSYFLIIDKLSLEIKLLKLFCPSSFMAAFWQFLIQIRTADWLSEFLVSKRRHWAPGAGSSISLDFQDVLTGPNFFKRFLQFLEKFLQFGSLHINMQYPI